MERGLHRLTDRRTLLRLAALGLTGAAALRAIGVQAEDELDVEVAIPRDIGRREHWVAVNLSAQAAVAMVGRDWVHRAWVTTGADGWETPEGEFSVVRRVYNETMTSAALGIPPGPDSYHLTDVLFTQYFTGSGAALHYNYWSSNFGAAGTHGCLGVNLDDALWFWHWATVGTPVHIH